MSVHQILEEAAESIKLVLQERIQQLTAGQIVKMVVPREKIVEFIKLAPQES